MRRKRRWRARRRAATIRSAPRPPRDWGALLVPRSRRRRNASAAVEDDVPEPPAEVNGVDLAAVPLTETGQAATEGGDPGTRVTARLRPAEHPCLAAGVVGEHVETAREGEAGTVIGVAADDGGPVVRMVVDGDRSAHLPAGARGAIRIRHPPFHARPAEVDAGPAADVGDLFPSGLTDIADPKRTIRAIDRRPPRVAQAPVVDEPLVGVRRVRERVARRDAVVVSATPVVDVDAQDLA